MIHKSSYTRKGKSGREQLLPTKVISNYMFPVTIAIKETWRGVGGRGGREREQIIPASQYHQPPGT